MLASLATGVLLGVCQIDLSPLAWVALAPLGVACHGRRPLSGAALGMAAGLVAGLALYGLSPYGWLLFAVLVVYCGLHMAGFGLGIAWLSGRVPPAVRVCLPALLWTGFEYLRRYGAVSFPITLSGTQTDLLPLMQIARWTGAHGVSFLVALPAGLALVWATTGRPPVRAALAQAVAVGAALALGAAALGSPAPSGGRTVRVAGVQAGLPNWVYRVAPVSREHRELVLDTLVGLSEQAVGGGAALVAWPETALHEPVLARHDLRERIEAHARGRATLLVGTVRDDSGGGRYNTVVALPPDGGEPGLQDKLRPAGYAEWHITPGLTRAPLATNAGRVGVLICLESVYPQDAMALADLGAELLVVTTDDAGFRRSPMARFHGRRSAYRALETGRWVLHTSQAGPSYLFDPRGRPVVQAGLFERTVLAGSVTLTTAPTPYQRIGDAFCWAVWATLAALVAWSRRGRASRRASA